MRLVPSTLEEANVSCSSYAVGLLDSGGVNGRTAAFTSGCCFQD